MENKKKKKNMENIEKKEEKAIEKINEKFAEIIDEKYEKNFSESVPSVYADAKNKAMEGAAPTHYIAVGASAGGLEAIEDFFRNMPPKTHLAFIVIQHLSPNYKSLMVELLSKHTDMPVCRADDGMSVEKNTVYLIPPKKNLTIFHGKLLLSDQHSQPSGMNLPIDIFFRSLAEDQGERSIGIILSGTGSDGVRGIRAIKENGGMVMVQTEETAKFNGMPRSAIATGLTDFIMPVNEMPDQLLSYVKHPFVTKSQRSDTLVTDEDVLNKIFSKIREKTKADFTFYKPSTMIRRIERRMMVNQLSDLREYYRFFESTSSEVLTLYRDLLIGVTNFLRDKEAFELLENVYLPEIFSSAQSDEIRFWVAGCSTGEEAYSLAILCQETMDKIGKKIKVKIFATDIDQDAIARAGNGIYPESIVADLNPTLLSRYFNRREDNFHIVSNIRKMVVFAQHNLIKDPPFTNISFISCRNLLIYFQPILQRKALEYFNFSLNPGGLLFLGSSETIGDMNDYFDSLNHKWKIYRSKGKRHVTDVSESILRSSNNDIRIGRNAFGKSGPATHSQEDRILERILDTLSQEYLPVAITVNQDNAIIHSIGETGRYFRLPSGKMHNDIVKMAQHDLAIPLATGLQKVFRKNEEVWYNNVRLNIDEKIINVQLHIKQVHGKRGQEPLALIVISSKLDDQKDVDDNKKNYDLGKEAEQRIADLEQELQFTKENLQATVEELETSNEELQATNEELLSSNEELQSTNEELQSVNEELHTVNAEHQSKIIELTELNNDMDNLLSTSGIAILFLDENLEIRRFTPKIKDIFSVLDTDLGRPFDHISHVLMEEDLVNIIQGVQSSEIIFSKEVRTNDGQWFLLKILPYQIAPQQYSGILLHFVDITRQVEYRKSLEKSEERSILAQKVGRIGFWDLNLVTKELEWSGNVESLFGLTDKMFPGTFDFFIGLVHEQDREFVEKSIKIAIEKEMEYNIEHRIIWPDKSVHWMHEIGKVFYDKDGKAVRMVGVVRNVTDKKKFEELMQKESLE